MKNKTHVMDQPTQVKRMDWLYLLEDQDNDFLFGKTASSLPDIWEDEE